MGLQIILSESLLRDVSGGVVVGRLGRFLLRVSAVRRKGRRAAPNSDRGSISAHGPPSKDENRGSDCGSKEFASWLCRALEIHPCPAIRRSQNVGLAPWREHPVSAHSARGQLVFLLLKKSGSYSNSQRRAANQSAELGACVARSLAWMSGRGCLSRLPPSKEKRLPTRRSPPGGSVRPYG